MYFVKTVESPCRTCENENMNKEECSVDCLKLHAFQNAILRQDERNIRNFQSRVNAAGRHARRPSPEGPLRMC